MKIKLVLAILAGGVAEILAGIALWAGTQMEILEIAAWMMAVYAATVSGVLLLTEKWDIAVRVRIHRRDSGPQLYDLRQYPEWSKKEKGKIRKEA